MKKLIFTGLLCCFIGSTQLTNAQGTTRVSTANDYSRLYRASFFPFSNFINNTSKSLGVYQMDLQPVSILEVNSNTSHLPLPNTTILRSEVFSTDAGATDTYWRMKKFGVEYGLLYSDPANDFNVQATQSKLWFRTAGNTPRVLVDNAVTNGATLFSNNATGLVPAARLHVHLTTANASDIRITNASTGALAGDGLRIGVTPTGLDAGVVMQEVGSLYFGSSNTPRMRILDIGRTIVGFNVTASVPTNRFVIDADPTDPTPSGLQFTDVNSGSATVANPGPGVLALDLAGNVIYVPGGGSTITGANNGLSVLLGNVQLGGACGSGLGALINSTELPMANFDLNFTMPASSTSQINIGAPSCTTGVSRVSVLNDFYANAGTFFSQLASAGAVRGGAFRGQNNGAGNANGINCSALTTSSSANAIAVSANSQGGSGFNSFYNIGVNALTANASFASICVNADVLTSTSPLNYGIQSEVQNNTNASASNIGGEFIVSNNAVGSTNIGVRAIVPTAAGGTGPDWAGYFGGDVFTTTAYYPSDRNLKTNIQTIENSLDIVNKLRPVTYQFDTDKNPGLGLSTVNQWGFISQEVEVILPELTKQTKVAAVYDSLGKEITSEKEILTLNYNGFIAILTKAIQEQQKQIDELKEMLNITNTTTGNTENINTQDVELSDRNYVVLDQNMPNPFAETTSISYIIPENATQAQMIFYNALGQAIKTVEVTDRGRGILNVYANDLSTGIYSYSLFVDGKLIDTKRMVKK